MAGGDAFIRRPRGRFAVVSRRLRGGFIAVSLRFRLLLAEEEVGDLVVNLREPLDHLGALGSGGLGVGLRYLRNSQLLACSV